MKRLGGEEDYFCKFLTNHLVTLLGGLDFLANLHYVCL